MTTSGCYEPTPAALCGSSIHQIRICFTWKAKIEIYLPEESAVFTLGLYLLSQNKSWICKCKSYFPSKADGSLSSDGKERILLQCKTSTELLSSGEQEGRASLWHSGTQQPLSLPYLAPLRAPGIGGRSYRNHTSVWPNSASHPIAWSKQVLGFVKKTNKIITIPKRDWTFCQRINISLCFPTLFHCISENCLTNTGVQFCFVL